MLITIVGYFTGDRGIVSVCTIVHPPRPPVTIRDVFGFTGACEFVKQDGTYPHAMVSTAFKIFGFTEKIFENAVCLREYIS